MQQIGGSGARLILSELIFADFITKTANINVKS
jgi:hypothetical protein